MPIRKNKNKVEPEQPSSLEEVRGQSLVDLLSEHAPTVETDLPPRRPRGRSQHYKDESRREH